MAFHPSKCEVIGFNSKAVTATPKCYELHSEAMPTVVAITYLGVKIQCNLKWHQQTDYITDKTASTLGFIKPTMPSQSTNLRATAYKQLIQPFLEYASCAWDLLPKVLANKVKAGLLEQCTVYPAPAMPPPLPS